MRTLLRLVRSRWVLKEARGARNRAHRTSQVVQCLPPATHAFALQGLDLIERGLQFGSATRGVRALTFVVAMGARAHTLLDEGGDGGVSDQRRLGGYIRRLFEPRQ